MQQTPTPWQYLLSIVTKSKLAAAATSKDPAFRARQERYYTDLQESECVFSRPIKSGESWLVDVTCRGRGFQLKGLPYKTGTLVPMFKPMTNIMVKKEALDLNTMTGVYFVMENEQLHLLVHPQSNIWEALKMTGYEFSPSQFSTEVYPERNDLLKADGHVDIKDTVVSGRIYISYIQKPPVKVTPEPEAPVIPPVETVETKPEVAEKVEVKPEDQETEQSAPVEEKKAEEVVEAPKPQQQYQNNKRNK